ncbi:MAG: phytase [Gemmatimonadetes bacterium]|nr:phytase [Gemmatimonadota bacterium]
MPRPPARRFALALIAYAAIPAPAPMHAQAATPATATRTAADSVATVAPLWVSERHAGDDLDSPAAWRAPSGQVWVITTAKVANALYVIDGVSGRSIRKAGATGRKPGQLSRPNGAAVWGDILLVVERDNQRVQAFQLPAFKFMGFIGDDALVKPYGLALVARSATTAEMYVTENADLGPYPEEHAGVLARRVKKFTLTRTPGAVKGQLVLAFGDTAGGGKLAKVESIAADSAAGRLVIADEAVGDLNVYTLDGKYESDFGRKRFRGEPEGIVLYGCGATAGYWVATDQHARRNRFHLFERESRKYLATFTVAGVSMTDGVALLPGAVGKMQGAFYVLNNDTNVAAVSFGAVLAALKLPDPCPAPAAAPPPKKR